MDEAIAVHREVFIPGRFPQDLKDVIISGEFGPWSPPQKITPQRIADYVNAVGDDNPAHRTTQDSVAIVPGGLLAGMIADLLPAYRQLIALDSHIRETVAEHSPQWPVRANESVSARVKVTQCIRSGNRILMTIEFEVGKWSSEHQRVSRTALIGKRSFSLKQASVY